MILCCFVWLLRKLKYRKGKEKLERGEQREVDLGGKFNEASFFRRRRRSGSLDQSRNCFPFFMVGFFPRHYGGGSLFFVLGLDLTSSCSISFGFWSSGLGSKGVSILDLC